MNVRTAILVSLSVLGPFETDSRADALTFFDGTAIYGRFYELDWNRVVFWEKGVTRSYDRKNVLGILLQSPNTKYEDLPPTPKRKRVQKGSTFAPNVFWFDSPKRARKSTLVYYRAGDPFYLATNGDDIEEGYVKSIPKIMYCVVGHPMYLPNLEIGDRLAKRIEKIVKSKRYRRNHETRDVIKLVRVYSRLVEDYGKAKPEFEPSRHDATIAAAFGKLVEEWSKKLPDLFGIKSVRIWPGGRPDDGDVYITYEINSKITSFDDLELDISVMTSDGKVWGETFSYFSARKASWHRDSVKPRTPNLRVTGYRLALKYFDVEVASDLRNPPGAKDGWWNREDKERLASYTLDVRGSDIPKTPDSYYSFTLGKRGRDPLPKNGLE